MAECRRRRRCRCCCYSLCLCLCLSPCPCSCLCSCPCPLSPSALASADVANNWPFWPHRVVCCYRYCCQRAPHSPPLPIALQSARMSFNPAPPSLCCPLALLRFKLCLCLARKSINALNELQKTLPLTYPTPRPPLAARCEYKANLQLTKM